jgi:hypothetical protein
MCGPVVLLCAPQGLAARTLLRSGVLDTLLAGGAQVAAALPADSPLGGALRERGVEVVAPPDEDALVAHSPLRKLLMTQRYFTLGDGAHAPTLQVKLRTALGVLARDRPWTARAVRAGEMLLSRSRAARRALLALELAVDRADLWGTTLDRVRPDLVVCTSPGWTYPDALALRAARRRGVPTCAVVLGWDNPTAKGYRGAHVDRVVVWSERMAAQVARHHDIDPARCLVCGVPQFDRYLRPRMLPGREALCSALGLDPARQIVVFTTPSPDLWDRNQAVAEALAAACEHDRLGLPAQLVVRPHPNFALPRAIESVEPLREVAARHRDTHLMEPELEPGGLVLDMTPADQDRLGGLIAHAGCVVTVFSTPTLEALLVDTPVVGLAEDLAGAEQDARPGGRRAWEEFEHLQVVLGAGAARLSRSLDELIAAVAAYLVDPGRDREARARVAAQECGPLDGRSGERVGRMLLKQAGAG